MPGGLTYADWLLTRSAAAPTHPVAHGDLAPHLFPHQRDLVAWALRRGRAAIFADTGLGKTYMLTEWARHIPGRCLVLAPLAVAEQISREAAVVGVEMPCVREDGGARLQVSNYELLHRFDVRQFEGVVLDESSILKAYDGATRTAIIEAFRDTPYRLACTATPAPNDFTELGNHSEFLGIKSRVEMLAEYFVHDGGKTQDWRLKGHAQAAFWRWVSSWAAVVRSPADLGHDASAYDLPPLRFEEHVIRVSNEQAQTAGMLFAPQAVSLQDQRATRRMTMDSRAETAAGLAAHDRPCIVWCELNDEADAVEELTMGAVQIRGSDTPDVKRDRLLGFAEGRYRVLVTKPSIAGFGMNWQHCSDVVFVGASHSYEQTYQAIRRCWRFGQRRPVTVHVIRAETEQAIVANYRRKEADAARLGAEMAAHVKDSVRAMSSASREWNSYNPTTPMQVPAWVNEESQ